MSKNYCIITGEPITDNNNSKAHVIPSALGGRLKPCGVLSRNGNTLLGDKIDLPFIEAFQPLMTLLGASRDRGENQPYRLTDQHGQEYLVEFGAPLKLTKPEYREATTREGVEICIDARNLKELRTLLGRVKVKDPDFDIDEAIGRAVITHQWPEGLLKGRLQIGPRVVFPALFVGASIFAAHHGQAVHPHLKDYVSRFEAENPEMPPQTFYFMPSEQWISALGDVTHIIAYVASASRKQALVYFELFNIVSMAVLLPYEGTEDLMNTHAVDILSGTVVNVTIDWHLIDSVPWMATHKFDDKSFLQRTTKHIERLIRLSQMRAVEAQGTALVTKALGAPDNRPFVGKDAANVISELVNFTLLKWARPNTELASMEATVPAFEELYLQLESSLHPKERSAFRSSAELHRRKLYEAIKQKRADETRR